MDSKWIVLSVLAFFTTSAVVVQIFTISTSLSSPTLLRILKIKFQPDQVQPNRDSNSLNLTRLEALSPVFDERYLPIQYPKTDFENENLMAAVSTEFSSQNSEAPIILLWTKLFGRKDWHLGEQLGLVPFRKLQCPVAFCYVTDDRSKQDKASAVLVNFRDDFKFSDRPSHRPPHQHWVFFLWESPEHTYSWVWRENQKMGPLLNQFSGFFNWTMTYRLDSDIPFLYGQYRLKPNPTPALVTRNLLRGRSRNVIWIQSNCDTRSHRTEFVKELQRHIDVDVIGTCAKSSSPITSEICNRPNFFEPIGSECSSHVAATYRFYLATENSLCRDYVTEKFYRAATLGMIPVVLNGANMSDFAPPHSFINARDYESPKHLATALTEIADDPELYNSYFAWRQYYDAVNLWDNDAFTRVFCDLCAKVTQAKLNPKKHAKVYDNINKWWMTDSNCFEGRHSFG